MNTIIEKLKEMLVVPVVVLDDVKDAEKLADALVGGGLPCAEVTFRTAAAEDKNIPILPGVISPSEAAQAVKRGLSVVKFFPAEQYGGVTTIKALAAPYTMLKFMPTGGVSVKNLKDYLSCDKIICCGGSWMVKGDMIKSGEFDKIKQMTKEAVELAHSIRK
mgnify:CR=1 FL=1